MVTTRGQQPVLASQPAANSKPNLTDPPILVEASNANPNSYDEDQVETIGSRLRKRRRTGSSPKTTPSQKATTTSKRSNPKKRMSPESKSSQASRAQNGDRYVTSPGIPYSTPYSSTGPLPALQAVHTTNGHQDAATFPNPEASGGMKGPSGVAEDATSLNTSLQAQQLMPLATVSPDLAALIRNIVERGEAIDRRYSEMGYVDTESFVPLGASLHLKVQCLPILDNLATQILNTLAKSTYLEILKMSTDSESESGQAYTSLKSLFNHTKKVYSIEDHFLSPHELGLVESAQLDTIRKANMATYISSVFGSQDVGFYYLNEYFLDTFVADGNRLLKSQAQLFLDLKTHAYISASSNGKHSREELLEDLFPPDLEDRLLSRRRGAKQLAPSEADFLKRARNRSKSLLEESRTDEGVALLPEKYIWEDYLRDVRAYVIKNFADIAGIPGRKSSRSSRASNFFVTDPQQPEPSQSLQPQQFEQTAEKDVVPEQVRPSSEIHHPEHAPIFVDTNDIAEKAARAAQLAIQGFDLDQAAVAPHHNMPDPMHQPVPPQQQIQYQFECQPPHSHYFQHSQYSQTPHMQHPMSLQPVDMNHQHQVHSDQNAIPYPTQSAPTKDLYARARAAASAKASPTSRRAGHPSQRRPWTTDEENALMQGLDCVKGPHWSQILAMFGPGGTVNEILKDRNQVQLKDKARNLKLFFLKSQIEVPYYLSFVTGELKTRAPAQAAKNEAKEKEKRSEDRAQFDSMAALARGSTQDGGVADALMEGVEGDFKGDVADDTDGLDSIAVDNSNEDDLSLNCAEGSSLLHDEEYHPQQPLQFETHAQANGDHSFTNGLLEESHLEVDKNTDDEADMAQMLTN
ncbi:TTAGGG repeat binding factor [Pseudocyphellaria aurata]|nr:TTAGGG repeat binding factor [Pseudocyphellaria aurata]